MFDISLENIVKCLKCTKTESYNVWLINWLINLWEKNPLKFTIKISDEKNFCEFSPNLNKKPFDQGQSNRVFSYLL